MCGRYYVDDETANEINKIVKNIDKKLKLPRSGDIYPSEPAAVMREGRMGLTGDIMAWGFPRFDNKGFLINARAEGIFERKAFKDSILYRRCIIPAKGFYEWDTGKTKYSYERKDSPVLFMAGCFDTENRFVIITTKANPSVSPVHDRMPLVLEPDELKDWVLNPYAVEYILRKTPPMLNSKTDYEQLNLF